MVFIKPHKKNKLNKKKNKLALEQPVEIIRVRTPKNNEVIGILESRLGGSRVRVKCYDGKTRICRIPGRLKRKLWVREGDTLLIEPWELGGDAKGDVIYKYKPNQVPWLKNKGFIKEVVDEEEF
ncbi:MAG: translation initiation factor eIF-1A [Nanoarchaeota archaeon]|nr:translation initiation factor eIF-1A [Nanoarchaeota archaeon]MBU4352358.1 translation initiation factor eIF-1A [Nanoarchaeota archaeon]MBU4456269.1 translation initiation factor eIF-1A [Nanoarchaeota archaeon]MCG2720384.1 translation initiation factor eIF-1A [Nanoarchaeota archaeon]